MQIIPCMQQIENTQDKSERVFTLSTFQLFCFPLNILQNTIL